MICLAAQDEIKMSKGKRFVFTIEPDLHESLTAQARRERRSVGSLLNLLIAKYLEEQQGLSIDLTIQHGGDRKLSTVKNTDVASIPAIGDTNLD